MQGKYWKEGDEWIARLEGLDLEVKTATPYQSLLKLVEALIITKNNENYDCSISLIDAGFFYLKLTKSNETSP